VFLVFHFYQQQHFLLALCSLSIIALIHCVHMWRQVLFCTRITRGFSLSRAVRSALFICILHTRCWSTATCSNSPESGRIQQYKSPSRQHFIPLGDWPHLPQHNWHLVSHWSAGWKLTLIPSDGAGGAAKAVERLASKCEALSSNPSTNKK
jgi:hypothetical protein